MTVHPVDHAMGTPAPASNTKSWVFCGKDHAKPKGRGEEGRFLLEVGGISHNMGSMICNLYRDLCIQLQLFVSFPLPQIRMRAVLELRIPRERVASPHSYFLLGLFILYTQARTEGARPPHFLFMRTPPNIFLQRCERTAASCVAVRARLLLGGLAHGDATLGG